jgi:hypothetical protein
MMTPSSSLREKVLAESSSRRSRTRKQGRRRAILVYTIAALVSLPPFFLLGGFAHSASRPLSMTIGMAFGSLLLAVSCASVVWWRGRSLIGPSQTVLVSVAVLVPVVTYAWLVAFHERYLEPVTRVGYRCLALTSLSALPLLIAVIYLRKRTIALHPASTGAALGAAAGAFGNVMTTIYCPLTYSPHVLVGHVLPIVALSLVGGVCGRLVLAIK